MQNYKTNCFNSDNLSIKCGDRSINFEKPLVMGILNLTPDSFYDGGSYLNKAAILKRSEQILSEGAEIIDLGAYSTRPGAADVSAEQEILRLIPAVECIRKEFPDAILSIDTFRAEVAKRIVADFGACIINDISGGTMDDKMFSVIGELKVPYIMMHIKGTPQTMQQNPVYHHLMNDMLAFFRLQIKRLNEFGAKDIIIDPGFGFGKTLDHNYEIIANLQEFNQLDLPILIGVSRKSMIYKFLGGDPSMSLNGTTALNMMALDQGANILRVHDVKEAVECVKLYSKIKSSLQ
ncbi:dihydropteroate synthase [Labilibaculum manganireducens]|uniref:Dihydropteroate synthase n=1 Tax=Labilibaculum manganireducens TaxID=1940525 RepID=A0A2N3IEH7_9BACT|nr:dihydropteroate synthase [Labilibaculum manganireducens]PKQ68653.1 dihydropteroate synthase [Labilibaculum manganireducens]